MRLWYVFAALAGVVLCAPARAAETTWESIGPSGITVSGSQYAAGRVSSTVFTPSGALLAASASGGVWKNSAPGSSGSAWSAVGDDSLPALSFGQLAVVPSVSTPDGVMYAATGEGHDCLGCFPGNGIAESTDGGTTWSYRGVPKGPDGKTTRFSVALIEDSENSNHLWLATETGVYESTNAGRSWDARALCRPLSELPGTCITSLAPDPNDHARIFAADYRGVFAVAHTSSPSDQPKYLVTSAQLPADVRADIAQFHIAVATASGPSTVMYVAFAARLISQHGCTVAVLRSGNGGLSWSALPKPPDYTSTGYAYNEDQATYSNVLRVNPIDPNDIVAGGIDLVRYRPSATRVGRWEDLSMKYGLHPDVHDVIFGHDGWVYVANDGGIDRLTASRTESLNQGLAITQFYPGAFVFGANHAIAAGTQDNGTVQIDALVATSAAQPWHQIQGGDGGFVSVDPTNQYPMLVESQAGTLYRQSSGPGVDQTTKGQLGQDKPPSWKLVTVSNTNRPFWPHTSWVMPFRRSHYAPNYVYAGAHNVYKSDDGGASFQQTNAQLTYEPYISNNVTALDVCGQYGDAVIAGWSTGLIKFSLDGGLDWLNLEDPSPTFTVVDVSIDTSNSIGTDNSASYYAIRADPDVTRDRFTDGPGAHANWSVAAYTVKMNPTNNGIKEKVVTDMASEFVSGRPLVIRAFPSDTLLGTTTGVYEWDGDAQRWKRLGDHLPRVPVVDLLYIQRSLADSTTVVDLIAVTYGRGMWLLQTDWVPKASFCEPPVP
jgi:hypothetical protein